MSSLRLITQGDLKVLKILWKNGEMTASQVAAALQVEIGWNRNTTYTVLKRCVSRGFIERIEPLFLCRPIVTFGEVRRYQTKTLICVWYDDNPELLKEALESEDY
mgnify:CR=1 FL=1